jgi:hypothetical protein
LHQTHTHPVRPEDDSLFDITPERAEPTWVRVILTEAVEGGWKVEGLTSTEWLTREFIFD